MSDTPAVSLREVTRDTVRAICNLEVAPSQRHFVAPNAVSIAQAHFAPEAWFRAIYAGDEPVGFLMLSVEPPSFGLWRLMVDHRHQGRGYGRAALHHAIDHVRTLGAKALETSYVPGDGCPEPFYRGLGFTPTGQVEDGEVVLTLALA